MVPDLCSWLTLVDDLVCGLRGEFVRYMEPFSGLPSPFAPVPVFVLLNWALCAIIDYD